jgi:ribosomal protein S18 acetylase RimI-like enzyme
MPSAVTLRPAVAADDDFLLALYATTRADLTLAGLAQAQLDALIGMQFQAQTRHYAEYYAQAERSVIEVAGTPAGRLIVEHSDEAILIVDIALLPAFRRMGAGSHLVRALFREADDRGVPIRCHVEVGNDARLFWEHLGFVGLGLDGAHLAMERECVTSPR